MRAYEGLNLTGSWKEDTPHLINFMSIRENETIIFQRSILHNIVESYYEEDIDYDKIMDYNHNP